MFIVHFEGEKLLILWFRDSLAAYVASHLESRGKVLK